MAHYKFTRAELKDKRAGEFKEGDVIRTGKYRINISFGNYAFPMKTTVENEDGKYLDCTAGSRNGWPYYIAAFIQGKR